MHRSYCQNVNLWVLNWQSLWKYSVKGLWRTVQCDVWNRVNTCQRGKVYDCRFSFSFLHFVYQSSVQACHCYAVYVYQVDNFLELRFFISFDQCKSHIIDEHSNVQFVKLTPKLLEFFCILRICTVELNSLDFSVLVLFRFLLLEFLNDFVDFLLISWNKAYIKTLWEKLFHKSEPNSVGSTSYYSPCLTVSWRVSFDEIDLRQKNLDDIPEDIN